MKILFSLSTLIAMTKFQNLSKNLCWRFVIHIVNGVAGLIGQYWMVFAITLFGIGNASGIILV
jgi:hypothetical protein